jgi:hypothetical protein
MKVLISLLASVLGSLICVFPTSAMDKKIVGWVERVRLQPANILLEAKLDTGAEYSSLDATNITDFSRNGEKWVRFDLNDHHGKTVTLESKLIRQAPIKRHYGKKQRRPVIRLGVCVGPICQETEVNLVDRTGFIYPMLIGRKFMEGRLVIDPAVKHTVEPSCGEQSESE